MSMPKHLVLVRHGLSEGNFARDMAKTGDSSYFDDNFRERPGHEWRLMPEGVQQAERAGLWIQEHIIGAYGLPGFDRYVYSPHRRTRETAASLNLPDAAWRMNRMLRERSWGEIEDLSREQHEVLYPRNYTWQKKDKMNWAPPGGESIVQISDGRVREFFDTLHRDHDQKGVDSVIAVTHGEWIWAARLALEYMFNEDWEAKDDDPAEKIHNCQVVKHFGVAGENSQGSRIVHLSKMVGKHRIVAEVNNIGYPRESVLVYEQRRTLPFVRYQSKKLINLHSLDPSFDHAIEYGAQKFFCLPESYKGILSIEEFDHFLDIVTDLSEKTIQAIKS